MSRNTPTGSAKFQCKTAGCMVGRSCHPSVFRKGESDAQIRQDIPTSKEFGSDMQFSPRRSFQQHQDHAVDHRCQCPEGDDRPGYGEHLRRHTGDESLWLCQDRHTVFSEFFQLPPKWGALIVLACRYKFKPARSTHIYLNLS